MKLKYLLPLFFSSVCLLSAGVAQAATSAVSTPASDFQPMLAYSKNCFSGPVSSYDGFVSMLKRKNPNNPNMGAMIHQSIPRAVFEQFQQHLHCEQFVYDVDGVKAVGYLILPKAAPARSLPVLVYNRGGNGKTGSLIFMNVMTQLMPLAAQGYAVFASNYRGEHNQLKLPPEQVGKDEFGGADVADVLAFKTMVNKVPAANPEHVAMMGHSRGGMQTWLAAKQWPELDALVIIAGVTDLAAELQYRPDMENVFKARIPDYANQKSAALQQRSVSHFLPQIRADLPVMIVHGDKDERVSVGNATQIAKLLADRKQPHELVIVPGGNHSLHKQMPQLREQMDQFIRRQLR
ncbi:alpha/beta hydrolase family protein [Rheinheimera texasensis]|uniref:alpha/beta hydrolase family protein n=1 Tax=Rheinheimera texasensis TaxID=306205 RepID=UPI00068F9B59|nr:alpha/beta fold hydrolase [Rheinheimera texasensis]